MKSLRFAVPAAVLALALTASADLGAAAQRPDPLVRAVESLDRNARWTLVEQHRLGFPTYHPQGLARAGDRLYLSSVEVIEPPVRYPAPVDGYDRTPGKGRGHLFELDLSGRLLRHITLGQGTMYHPGGIDFDGRDLWVPVAEYRPDSQSIIYRVDPRTLRATEAFRFKDHVGGIVRDRDLHGVSWGSRRMFAWTDRGGLLRRSRNESHFVDFQDCAAAGSGRAICTGLTEFPLPSGGRFDLGGIAVVNLRTDAIGHEVPVAALSPGRHVVTRNPVHLETANGTLRMWAAPDDSEEPTGTTLQILQTRLP